MDSQYGLLLNQKDILLQRKYFEEMCQTIGVKVIHRAPRPGKTYSTYSEIQSNYFEPEITWSIVNEFADQRTMRKLGWNAELDSQNTIISVPYNLEGLQQGSLFIIPSAFDNTKGRLFRVVEITGIMIYPASLTCRLVPEFENTFSPNLHNYKHNSFNLLNKDDEDNY